MRTYSITVHGGGVATAVTAEASHTVNNKSITNTIIHSKKMEVKEMRSATLKPQI